MNHPAPRIFEQGDVNRYWQTAHSLLDMTFVAWSGLLALLAIAICSFYSWPIVFPLSALAIACCLGLGHVTYLFQRAERRSLVPGMNLACANVTIGIAIALWVVIEIVAIGVAGLSAERAGICLLLIALALWTGWGERWVAVTLASPTIPMIVVSLFPQGPERTFNWYTNLPGYGHTLIGVSLMFAASAILLRYWILASCEYSVNRFRKIDQLLQSKKSILDRQQSLGEFRSQAKQPNQHTSTSTKVSTSLLTRLQEILYCKSYLSRRGQWLTLCAAAFIVLFFVSLRGNPEVSAAFSFLSAMLLTLIPTALFSVQLSQSFSRLWVMGIADSRTETAAKLLLLSAKRTATTYLLMIAILMVQVSWDSLAIAKMLFVLTVGLAVSGLVLWVTSKCYAYWSHATMVPQLVVTVMFVAGILFLMPLSIAISPRIERLIEALNIATSLIGIGTTTAIVWFFCITDSAKSLGNTATLGQHEASPLHLTLLDIDSLE